MASHGVPRQSSGGPKSEKARQKEQREIKEYKDLVDQVTERINGKDFSLDTLGLTSKLLKKNPEYYTIWNHRRRVLAHLFAAKSTDSNRTDMFKYVQEMIHADLDFLLPLLITFPKCYWIWNHRIWLLQQTSVYLPSQDAQKFWQQELSLVAKMLSRDNRNYHGWDYRRTIIAALRKFEESPPTLAASAAEPAELSSASKQEQPTEPTLTEQEFDYTNKMVRSNLSNFSAWHNRSKLIPRLLAERNADNTARRSMFDAELAFVDDALSMDPNDQSLWFYHQFLMSSLGSADASCFGPVTPADRARYLGEQMELFREVLEDWDACKMIYQNLLGFAEMYAAVAGEASSPISVDEMRSWLARLQELDPLRAGRWADLKSRLDL